MALLNCALGVMGGRCACLERNHTGHTSPPRPGQGQTQLSSRGPKVRFPFPACAGSRQFLLVLMEASMFRCRRPPSEGPPASEGRGDVEPHPHSKPLSRCGAGSPLSPPSAM